VQFQWDDTDRRTPATALETFRSLDAAIKQKVGEDLVSPIRGALVQSVEDTIVGGEDWAKRLVELEMVLRTDRNEFFTFSFPSARDAMKLLVEVLDDSSDLRGRLG